MIFLERELIRTHKTYESILALPGVPLITKGKQGKKNEDRLAFIEALDKSEIILEGSSFPEDFDPLKEKHGFKDFKLEELLEFLSAYHRTARKESDIFDAGLFNGNIYRIVKALKYKAKHRISRETDEDVRTYAFIDKGLMDTPLVMEAFEINLEAFKGEKDKGGMPYVYHPIRVALRCDTEESIAAALLHDVLEDHPEMFSVEDLLDRGIPKKVVDAVLLLTHPEGVSYLPYVYKASKNKISAKVKWADLMDNLNKSRNNNKHSYKSLYYFKSLSLLEKALNKEDKDSLYFYYPEEDVFVKKTTHGHFALDEGKYVHCPYRIIEEVFELTYYPGDEKMEDKTLPYFRDGYVDLSKF